MVSIVYITTDTLVSPWYFGVMLVVIYVPLCWIRKIEILAPTHLFADAMICITLFVLMFYAFTRIEEKAGFAHVPAVNNATFLDAIGASVYSYEGIGVVLPIYEVTKN